MAEPVDLAGVGSNGQTPVDPYISATWEKRAKMFLEDGRMMSAHAQKLLNQAVFINSLKPDQGMINAAQAWATLASGSYTAANSCMQIAMDVWSNDPIAILPPEPDSIAEGIYEVPPEAADYKPDAEGEAEAILRKAFEDEE